MNLKAVCEVAKCPFFLNTVSGSGYIGIKCEPLVDESHLGFRVENSIRLSCKDELKDYVEIFCADRWKTCPYSMAIRRFKYKEES